MRHLIILFAVVLVAVCYSSLSAQTERKDTTKDLERYFSNLSKSNSDNEKIAVNDSIIAFIDSYSISDTAFTHRFSSIRYLGQVTSPGSHMKIITWNLMLDSAKSRYYCYFINRSGKKNLVYKVKANYNETQISIDREYSGDDWYGALYYDLREIKKTKETYWILLGIEYGNPLITRKIVDVLSVSEGGKINFGKKLFVSDKSTDYRVVFEYSAEAVMSLKFVSDKSVVFDHLVPFKPSLKGKKEFYGPDYSYDSYTLERGGLWKLRTNVDMRNEK